MLHYVSFADSCFLLYPSDMILFLNKLITNIRNFYALSMHIKFKWLSFLRRQIFKPEKWVHMGNVTSRNNVKMFSSNAEYVVGAYEYENA